MAVARCASERRRLPRRPFLLPDAGFLLRTLAPKLKLVSNLLLGISTVLSASIVPDRRRRPRMQPGPRLQGWPVCSTGDALEGEDGSPIVGPAAAEGHLDAAGQTAVAVVQQQPGADKGIE